MEDKSPYKYRLLTENDHATVVRLHDAIHASNAQAEILRRDSPGRLLTNLSSAGVTFGAFVRDEMVAYAAIAIGGAAAADITPHVHGVYLAGAEVAVHDGSAVLPPHRGHGLQRQLNNLRLAQARELGCNHIVGSVSVLNPYSLQNHLDIGFRVRGFAMLYGGLPRAIIHRGPSPEIPARSTTILPLRCLSDFGDAFAGGSRGVGVTWNRDEPLLLLEVV